MIVPVGHVLALAGLVFLMGMACVVLRRSLIMMLLGFEIMLHAAAIAFVGGSLRWHQLDGQAIVFFLLAVAATEVSVGLALVVCLYRRTGSVDPGAAGGLE